MIRQSGWLALAAAVTMGAAAPASAREIVRYDGDVRPGTIVVKTSERRLYLVLGDGRAIRYPVAVGRTGKQWQGWAQVNGKHVEPVWSPTWCCAAAGQRGWEWSILAVFCSRPGFGHGRRLGGRPHLAWRGGCEVRQAARR